MQATEGAEITQRGRREEFSKKRSVKLNETSAVLCEAELLPLQKAHGAGKLVY